MTNISPYDKVLIQQLLKLTQGYGVGAQIWKSVGIIGINLIILRKVRRKIETPDCNTSNSVNDRLSSSYQ